MPVSRRRSDDHTKLSLAQKKIVSTPKFSSDDNFVFGSLLFDGMRPLHIVLCHATWLIKSREYQQRGLVNTHRNYNAQFILIRHVGVAMSLRVNASKNGPVIGGNSLFVLGKLWAYFSFFVICLQRFLHYFLEALHTSSVRCGVHRSLKLIRCALDRIRLDIANCKAIRSVQFFSNSPKKTNAVTYVVWSDSEFLFFFFFSRGDPFIFSSR